MSDDILASVGSIPCHRTRTSGLSTAPRLFPLASQTSKTMNGQHSSEFKLRGLKVAFGTLRTNDDVHGSISLCPLTIAIIDTPHMQRLRGLKQLGASDLTYTCTTHSRFEHSLGVAALAEQLLQGIQSKQPKLGITDKDVACVKIAGLLHDIGHGPYSHVYDGMFQKQLKKAKTAGMWLGQKIDASQYEGLPEVMDGWAHEDASLIMVDGLLKYLGLEIDEDNLDEPLKQIGDGIDARCFGICSYGGDELSRDENGELDQIPMDPEEFANNGYKEPSPASLHKDCVLTSRDWIFIKECIVGGPLPPAGMSVDAAFDSNSQKNLVGRTDRWSEVLYDVVSNRHSGLDVDKMDYLARDSRRANRESGNVDPMLLENSYV